MSQIKEVKLNSLPNKGIEKYFLLIPKLEKNVQQDILNTKIKYSKEIIIGVLLLMLGISFQFRYVQNQRILTYKYNETLYYYINTSICFLIGQIYAFMIDIISFNVPFIFSILLMTLCYLVQMNLQDIDQQILLFLDLMVTIGYYCSFLSIIYIIFDSYYSLQQRFNLKVISHAISVLPQILQKLLNLFNQPNILNGFYTSTISLGFFITGLVVLLFSYGKIEIYKQKSSCYLRYLTFQGMGITLKNIIQYHKNENVAFLLLISFTSQLCSNIQNPFIVINSLNQQQVNKNYNDMIQVIYYVSYIFPGLLISLFINSRKQILQTIMQFTRYFLNSSLIIYPIICIYVCIQTYFPYSISFAFFSVISIYQGSVRIVTYNVFFEVFTSLVHQRSAIKCLGFSFILFVQDAPKFILFAPLSPLTAYIIQLSFVLLTKILTKKYLNQRSFVILEQKLRNSLQSKPEDLN
ncbi:hypothetical protein ABPG74_014408 [Tetrahymena malaccensis]